MTFNVGDTVTMINRDDFEGSTAVIEEILPYGGIGRVLGYKLRHSNCSRRWPQLEGKTTSGWVPQQLALASAVTDECEAFFV